MGGGSSEWHGSLLKPLKDLCSVVLSFGFDPALALQRRNGGLGLHCQLFLTSKESLHIRGLPDISATVQWMCIIPARRANYLKHLFLSTGGTLKATRGTKIDGSCPQVG